MPKSHLARKQTLAAALSGVSVLTLAMALSGPVLAQQVIDDAVVTVPGDHASPWDVGGWLVVGDHGTGRLIIENGGSVHMTSGTIGRDTTGIGSVTVSGTGADGVGSVWGIDGALLVGGAGTGTLTVAGGGWVSSDSMRIASDLSGSGALIVSGRDANDRASLITTNNLIIGDAAISEGSLIVEAGARVETANAWIGGTTTSRATATVTGAGSTWINTGSFYVGDRGTGTLTIMDGGSVSLQSGSIGDAAAGKGTVVVSGRAPLGGAASHLEIATILQVGDQGDGTLNILDGGRVTSSTGTIGDQGTGSGTVLVSGRDASANASSWTNSGVLTVGSYGKGTLTVEGGARVTNAAGNIGNNATGVGTVSVSGTDANGLASSWNNSGVLTVGNYGQGTLTVASGSFVTSSAGYVGRYGDSVGTVIVSGTDAAGNGSSWTNAAMLYVGEAGTGTLIIEDGGQVSSAGGYIGRTAGSVGTVTISGSGSKWAMRYDNTIAVGWAKDAVGELTVSAAAVASADRIELGTQAGSKGILNIGTAADQAASAAGILDTAEISFRDGTGTLVLNHTDTDYALISTLKSTGSGTHAINHLAGTTLLTSHSSGFSGMTTVSGGTLLVGGADGVGSLGGDFDVTGSGTLGGSGTIGTAGSNVGIAAGGILAPGNSIGTLTVVGDVTFGTGSLFEVEIGGGGNMQGVHNDLLAVGGTARLDGGSVEVTALDPQSSYQNGQVYTILTAAGGVTGTFTEALSKSAFITPTLTHNANDVVLGIALNTVPTDPTDPTTPTPSNPGAGLFTQAALTRNQIQSATGLDDFDQTPGSDALAVYNQILMLSEKQAQQAFDLTSGELHASGQHVIDQTFALFGNTLRQQGAAGLGGSASGPVHTAPLAYGPATGSAGAAAIDDAMSQADTGVANAWLAPLGGRGTVNGDGNAAGLDWWNAGLAGGYERILDVPHGTAFAGFGLGYVHSHSNSDARRSSLDADGFYIGGYGAWETGPWSLGGSLAYAGNHVSTERSLVLGGIDRTAQADYWTHAVGLSSEFAYGLAIGSTTTLSPLVTLDAAWAGHGGFTETGAGALNLTGASESWARFDTGIGLALEHGIPTDAGAVILRGRAVWEHAFADVPSQSMRFAGSPTGFDILGTDAGRDRLRLGAGLAWDVSDEISLRADYEGLFSAGQSSHGGSAGLKVQF